MLLLDVTHPGHGTCSGTATTSEGAPTSHHFIQHDAKAVDIRLFCRFPPLYLLGAHVSGGAQGT